MAESLTPQKKIYFHVFLITNSTTKVIANSKSNISTRIPATFSPRWRPPPFTVCLKQDSWLMRIFKLERLARKFPIDKNGVDLKWSWCQKQKNIDDGILDHISNMRFQYAYTVWIFQNQSGLGIWVITFWQFFYKLSTRSFSTGSCNAIYK